MVSAQRPLSEPQNEAWQCPQYPGHSIKIIAFKPEYQKAAAELVNRGLGEHFGRVDESMNPDLFDIGLNYRDGDFMLAFCGEQLIGTGSLMPIGEGVGQIARMHTATEHRRQGVASSMLATLEKQAVTRNFHTVILETNTDWFEAITFYERNGYVEMNRNELGIRFHKPLEATVS